ncbi:hypothetical protein BGZ98_004249, partial [Dissophora globulifera]
LLELRSLKDFAAICQFMHLFHPAFALDDFETEDLEQALVDPSSLPYLVDLQARMLRTLTQDRRISFDNWFKYAQKEFERRAADQNPWIEEEATNYEGFSLETKLFILSNLCEWQLDDPERFRSNFKEEEEEVAVEWRVDPIGHDAFERTYWLFDDNRLYRENPPPPKVNSRSAKQSAPAPKVKAAPAPRRGTRRSTRGQRSADSPEPDPEPGFETPPITPGVEWEPVCITKQDWEEFSGLFQRSKHPDEKALHSFINRDILPKVLGDFKEKEKEREKLEAIANRKRSSRIVVREFEVQEKARLEAIRQQDLQAAMEQRKEELRERRAERERQQQQQIRDNRLKEREQRLKAREDAIWAREAKKKEQQLRIAKEREARKERRLAGGHHDDHSEDDAAHHDEEEEEEDWVFDCVCGIHGNNLDDGELMIACGKCNVWQHVACLKQEDAAKGKKVTNWDTVDFTCSRCIIKEQKKKARKEKREQKLKQEAMAMVNGTVTNGGPGPQGDVDSKTKKKKQGSLQSPKSPTSLPENGHYPAVPPFHSSMSPPVSQTHAPYSGQVYNSQLQPYPTPVPFHQGSGVAPQPYYGGHASNHAGGHVGPPHSHYAYQPSSQQQQQHVHQQQQPQHQQQPYYAPPAHQQAQPYQQPYPPSQAASAHYGSHGVSQSYQPYPATAQYMPPPQHQQAIQEGYSSSRPLHAYGSKNESYGAGYKADIPEYGRAPMSGAFTGQGGAPAMDQKRPPADDAMEGVERPPKIAHHHP